MLQEGEVVPDINSRTPTNQMEVLHLRWRSSQFGRNSQDKNTRIILPSCHPQFPFLKNVKTGAGIIIKLMWFTLLSFYLLGDGYNDSHCCDYIICVRHFSYDHGFSEQLPCVYTQCWFISHVWSLILYPIFRLPPNLSTIQCQLGHFAQHA